MHWQNLLEVTYEYGRSVDGQSYDTAYEEAIRSLRWDPAQASLGQNIQVFEDFLKAWRSWRRELDKEKLNAVWISDIEPYARTLDGEIFESLDVDKVVEVGTERLRVGVTIEHVYGALHMVDGIDHTNASKLLHLRLPNLFVMTDSAVRDLFKTVWGSELFSAYGYAFNFLRIVKAEMLEAILTLCKDKSLSQPEGIEYLQNAHGRKRSLAKLIDEYYWKLCH